MPSNAIVLPAAQMSFQWPRRGEESEFWEGEIKALPASRQTVAVFQLDMRMAKRVPCQLSASFLV